MASAARKFEDLGEAEDLAGCPAEARAGLPRAQATSGRPSGSCRDRARRLGSNRLAGLGSIYVTLVQSTSADRCLWLQLAAAFVVQPAPALHYLPGPSPGSSRAERTHSARMLQPAPLRNPMNTMTPTRPAGRHACRGHLATGPAGEAGARSQIRAVICAWDAAAAADVAVLLTSELGINAIKREAGETVTLAIGCAWVNYSLVSTTPRAPGRRSRAPQLARRPGWPAGRQPSRLSGASTAPRGQSHPLHARAPATPRQRRGCGPGQCRSRSAPVPETPAWRACAQSVHLTARPRSRGSGFPVASHRGRAGCPPPSSPSPSLPGGLLDYGGARHLASSVTAQPAGYSMRASSRICGHLRCRAVPARCAAAGPSRVSDALTPGQGIRSPRQG